MALSTAAPTFTDNRLLAALPRKELQRLQTYLDSFPITAKQVLYQPEESIRYVYFVGGNMLVSHLVVMENGTSVEIGMMGSEGMVGLPVLYGEGISPFRTMVQSGGNIYRMKTEELHELLDESAILRQTLDRFMGAFWSQIAQAGACNRLHSLEQRLCRWLLMALDRVGGNQLLFTHEFLANILGVRRASVTEAAVALQDKGLIDYRWGKIWVRNRRGLESACCECYRIITARYQRLLREAAKAAKG
jgi:CRP-like cAMP-binding protein